MCVFKGEDAESYCDGFEDYFVCLQLVISNTKMVEERIRVYVWCIYVFTVGLLPGTSVAAVSPYL